MHGYTSLSSYYSNKIAIIYCNDMDYVKVDFKIFIEFLWKESWVSWFLATTLS